MDHSYYSDRISAYSDGALEAQERELIRRHLEECADCRSLFEKLNHLSAVIEEKSVLGNNEYFENLARKIDRKIAAPGEKAVDVRELRWNSFWWKISAVAATIVLVGTIGFYQYEDDKEMPAKVLEDFGENRAPAAVMTDSVSGNEEAELQGGRLDSKEMAGKVTESETPQVNREEINTPASQEAVKRVKVDEDKIQMNDKFAAPTQIIISKPAEQKAKVSDEKVAELGAPDVGKVAADEADGYTMSVAISDSINVQKLTLVQWRSQRDSIQNALGLEDDTVVNSAISNSDKSAALSASGLVKASDSTKIYQELANSWYQIALQTQDGNEKNRAVQFLNWYKNRFPTDSPKVNVQLQQVPK